jgi:hypothetical protein
MGIEIQLSPPTFPGQTATFIFQNQVQAFVLGINEFYLTYGDSGDHCIEELQIKLSPSQPAVNEVTAEIQAQMHDASGHTIDPSSYVSVVCIAITGAITGTADDPKTLLTNVRGISNNATAPIDLGAASGFSVVESFLSGFTLQYSSGDHWVLHADAGCGITYQQSNGSISASAHLYDASGNQGTALIDAGVAVSHNAAGPGFFMQEVTAQGGPGTYVTFNEMKSISNAFAVLRSWRAQYGDGDHWVLSLKVGVFYQPLIQGNSVILQAWATIWDASGHGQDDSISNVTLAVIAVP